MGFFSKLFRRNKHSQESKSPTNNNNHTNNRSGGGAGGGGGTGGVVSRLKNKGRNKINSSSTKTDRDSPTELLVDDALNHQNGGSGVGLLSAAQRRAGPDLSEGSQRVMTASVKSPRSSNGEGEDTLSSASLPPNKSSSVSSSSSPWRAHRTSRQNQLGTGGTSMTSNTGPVDLDASDIASQSSMEENTSPSHLHRRQQLLLQPRLSSQRLEEFDKQQTTTTHVPVFTMEDASHVRFSAGQNMQEPGSNSEDEESSSFNLSTDAEDTDYENLKKRGVIPYPMDTSMSYSAQYNTDGETSVSVFPNLPTDDEATTGTTEQQMGMINDHPTTYKHPTLAGGGAITAGTSSASSPLRDPLRLSPKNSNDSSSIDAMAWAKDNNNFGNTKETAAAAFNKPQPYQSRSYSSGFVDMNMSHNTNNGFHHAPGTAAAALSMSSSRPFTSPKSKPQQQQPEPQFDDFANFADFSNITFPSDPAWQIPSSPVSKQEIEQPQDAHSSGALSSPSQQQTKVGHLRSAFEDKTPSSPTRQQPRTSAQNAVYSDTSLSELLAQAKSKSTGSRTRQKSGNSVNSAPAITSTAAYLRQHHNLKPVVRNNESTRGASYEGPGGSTMQQGGGGGGGTIPTTDPGGAGTSVSDIIHSLEAANASRLKSTPISSSNNVNSNNTSLNTSLGSGSHNRHQPSSTRAAGEPDTLSVHSRDNASVRSAKERLRRRREQRASSSSNRNGSDSSESDENGSESWLIDEVTGALGPRGIAPDLESLSGRSNRSRSSGGGRSHKSHRSHRSSRRSSSGQGGGGGTGTGTHRRVKSASGGESVSSHGSRRSRGSRHSRSSRYSHRSTRSYLSQMSEQSRSVANDLLRLEMQLAMVGSGNTNSINLNNNNDDANSISKRASHAHTSSSSRHSSSRASRGSSRRSNAAAARRTRMTIIAPSGKLGIILANKADSKGTVVSGVRTSSVMAEQISPGDRIVAIDGEDVSLMTVSEITTIMARKADFERTLTVLTTPRHSEPLSPRSDYDYSGMYKN